MQWKASRDFILAFPPPPPLIYYTPGMRSPVVVNMLPEPLITADGFCIVQELSAFLYYKSAVLSCK